jgi:hypothetical protein
MGHDCRPCWSCFCARDEQNEHDPIMRESRGGRWFNPLAVIFPLLLGIASLVFFMYAPPGDPLLLTTGEMCGGLEIYP